MIDQTVVARLQKDVKLSQTEKSVMQYLVENTDEAIKIGIRGVAQKGYTSTATVMRLAKKLGFEGFREMVYSFRNEMNQASNTLTEELREQIHFIYDMQKLEIFFRILARRGFVCIQAEGHSALLAEYLEKKLLGNACIVIRKDYLGADTIVRNFRDQLDAMVIISKSGNSIAGVEVAKKCKKAQIPTVVFTGNARSELSRICDTVFIIKDSHPFDPENLQANYFFGYCILAFEEIFAIYNHQI